MMYSNVSQAFLERRGLARLEVERSALMIARPRTLGAAAGTIRRAAEELRRGARLAVHVTVSSDVQLSATTVKVLKMLNDAGFVDVQEIVVHHEGWARGRLGALRQAVGQGQVSVTSRLVVGSLQVSAPLDPQLGFNPSPDCSPVEWALFETDVWALSADSADWFGDYEIARRLIIRTTQPDQVVADVDCDGPHVQSAVESLGRKYVRVPSPDLAGVADREDGQQSLFEEVWSGDLGV